MNVSEAMRKLLGRKKPLRDGEAEEDGRLDMAADFAKQALDAVAAEGRQRFKRREEGLERRAQVIDELRPQLGKLDKKTRERIEAIDQDTKREKERLDADRQALDETTASLRKEVDTAKPSERGPAS